MKSALIAACLLAAGGQAAAIEPSEAVMAPYRDYLAAFEAGERERAAELAEQAFQAGRAEGIEQGLLEALAENRAQALSEAGEPSRSAEAFVDLARMVEARAGADEERAGFLARAAAEAFRAEDLRAAQSHASAAAGLLGDAPSGMLYSARMIIANAEWGRGRYRQAGASAEAAIEVIEALGEPVVNLDAAMLAFMAGGGRSMRQQHEQAAYFFALSTALVRETDPDWVNSRAADAWSIYSRGNLDRRAQTRLVESLGESVYAELLAAEPERWEREGPDIPEGAEWADASPIQRQTPSYPMQAAQAMVDGVSVHRFTVGADGRVEEVETLFSIPHRIFGESGERAIRRWRYEPARLDGQAVEREGVITSFQFMMDR